MSAPTASDTVGHQQAGANAARDPAWTESATKDPITDAAVGKANTKLDDTPENSAAAFAAFNVGQGVEKLRDNVMGVAEYVSTAATTAASQAVDATKSATTAAPAAHDTPAPADDAVTNSRLGEAGEKASDAAASAAQYVQDNAAAASQTVKDALSGIAARGQDTGSDLAARTDEEASRKADQAQAAIDAGADKPVTFVPSASEKTTKNNTGLFDYAADTINYAVQATQNRASQVAEHMQQTADAGGKAAQEQGAAAQDATRGVAGGFQDAASQGAQKVQHAQEASKTSQGDALRDGR